MASNLCICSGAKWQLSAAECRLLCELRVGEGAATVSFLCSPVSTAEPWQGADPCFSSSRRYNGFLIDSSISNCFWTRACWLLVQLAFWEMSLTKSLSMGSLFLQMSWMTSLSLCGLSHFYSEVEPPASPSKLTWVFSLGTINQLGIFPEGIWGKSLSVSATVKERVISRVIMLALNDKVGTQLLSSNKNSSSQQWRGMGSLALRFCLAVTVWSRILQ